MVKLDSRNLTKKDFELRWPVEMASRKQFLDFLISKNSERVLFGDVDEFPTINQIKYLNQVEQQNQQESFVIPMSLRYQKVNWRVSRNSDRDWKSVISFSPKVPPELNQKRKYDFEAIPEVGLHLSYLDLDASQMTKKFSEFSHLEYSGFGGIEAALTKFSKKYGVDHLGRAHIKDFGLFRAVPFNSLSQLERLILDLKPSWFDFPIFPCWIRRAAASILITEVRNRNPKAVNLVFKLDVLTDCELSRSLAFEIVLMWIMRKIKYRLKMSVLSPSRDNLDWDS